MSSKWGAPEKAAKRLRIDAWNRDGQIHFPVDPFAIADKLGIKTSRGILDADTAGFIVKRHGADQVRAVVNASDAPVRQRFTLAHELGHYVQHKDDAELGFVEERAVLSSTGTSWPEIWANKFAAELLMPRATVVKWWASDRTVEDMARRFDVSKAAMLHRIKNLGLNA
ncbi:ImmA/IrrE family metallo-endopeptidase [Pseudoclavibacter sp. AY1F1]|uniref:ImmA/IrrE family metallo-endopeptidase n=1 Tax=Pseudoclavibacter sp. AY1F1 TaxID=2080583 RepID=UPI0015E3C81A|nr:ImmA/IrrE family metallo-endopeptidase [Pseudoclavibacter sp. AY1F1]